MKEQIRSHTPKYRTERVRFRFRAEGKEQRAEEPTRESHLPPGGSLSPKILGEPRSSLESWLEHATCISSRSNPRSQACVAPLCPSSQSPQGHLQQRNGSDMSIMRQSGHWGPRTRRTHLPKMGTGGCLAGSTPAFFAKLLQGQGSLCLDDATSHSSYAWRAFAVLQVYNVVTVPVSYTVNGAHTGCTTARQTR